MTAYLTDMKKNIATWVQKEKNIIKVSLAAALTFTLVVAVGTKIYADKVQAGIANQVLRLHVLANSDGQVDQTLKLKVRDRILADFETELSASGSLDETRMLLAERLSEIEESASAVIREEGFHYTVSAAISRDMFPTKTYGDITLPAGEYEALRVEIGAAEGQNWWCVMFPPLCFVDVTKEEVPEDMKDNLRNVLSEEAYSLVSADLQEETPIKVKFKIVEWWQERKNSDVVTIIEHTELAAPGSENK